MATTCDEEAILKLVCREVGQSKCSSNSRMCDIGNVNNCKKNKDRLEHVLAPDLRPQRDPTVLSWFVVVALLKLLKLSMASQLLNCQHRRINELNQH